MWWCAGWGIDRIEYMTIMKKICTYKQVCKAKSTLVTKNGDNLCYKIDLHLHPSRSKPIQFHVVIHMYRMLLVWTCWALHGVNSSFFIKLKLAVLPLPKTCCKCCDIYCAHLWIVVNNVKGFFTSVSIPTYCKTSFRIVIDRMLHLLQKLLIKNNVMMVFTPKLIKP